MSSNLMPCPFCGCTDAEEVTQHHDVYILTYGFRCNTCGASTGQHKYIEDAEAEWNRRTPGWISVDGRLPEPDTRVLVSCRTKRGQNSINMAYVDERGFWHGMGSMSGVRAWMPLPDAYEEQV
jgi:Lar family restriction alleviation protein